jgi:hypothetical protein
MSGRDGLQKRASYLCLSLKGTVSRDGYFFRSKMLISTICVSTDGFQGLSKAFNYSLAAGKMRKN